MFFVTTAIIDEWRRLCAGAPIVMPNLTAEKLLIYTCDVTDPNTADVIGPLS